MSVQHVHADIHELVDRLPPEGARRLRLLIESDQELSRFVSGENSEPRRVLPFLGQFSSGRGDISVRNEEIMDEELGRP